MSTSDPDTQHLSLIEELISISKNEWDFHEISWDFKILSLLHLDFYQDKLNSTYDKLSSTWWNNIIKIQQLEKENNLIFIEAYGLQDELPPEIPLNEITLTCNPHYRYGPGKTEEEYEVLLRSDSMKEFVSYAIGCMMGRYSLDEPGLIYAHSGNEGFDPSRYKTFPADDDGIIPVMDEDWFEDDATKRFVEFIKVTAVYSFWPCAMWLKLMEAWVYWPKDLT